MKISIDALFLKLPHSSWNFSRETSSFSTFINIFQLFRWITIMLILNQFMLIMYLFWIFFKLILLNNFRRNSLYTYTYKSNVCGISLSLGISSLNHPRCKFISHLSKLSFFTRRRISAAMSPHNFMASALSYAISSKRLFITDFTIFSTRSILNGFCGCMR